MFAAACSAPRDASPPFRAVPPPSADSTCAATPTTTHDRLTRYVDFAPVFLGGVVLRGRGDEHGVQAVLDGLGVTGTATRRCPEGALLVWIPGSAAAVAGAFTGTGFTVAETIVLAPDDGQSWLLEQCRDPARCDELAHKVEPDGLCGFTLTALGQARTEQALTRCRTLPPSTVTCALGVPTGEPRCRQSFLRALEPDP